MEPLETTLTNLETRGVITKGRRDEAREEITKAIDTGTQYVDVTGVKAMFGYPPEHGTVNIWRARRILPDPDIFISGRVAWRVGTIEKWADETGRVIVNPI